MSDSQRFENEHYIHLINSLSALLTKEIYLGDELNLVHNRYGFSDNDEKIIRDKLMQCIDKIKI